MGWISLFLIFGNLWSSELPTFLTKHSPETLRFISMDGRYAYVQKKPGVLGLVSSFRSIDFLSETQNNDFIVKSSNYRGRLVIESIPDTHLEMNLFKIHKISVVDYGNTIVRNIGAGRNAKLHLKDEWISFFNTINKVIHIENLVTQKKYEIKLSKKTNPFFLPDVEMISSRAVIYTDINDNGHAALISFDLQNLKTAVIYKSPISATKLELCQSTQYLAVGEFPFEGVMRGSKIQILPIKDFTNLSSFSTIYNTIDQDIGNMICLPDHLYFVKTLSTDQQLNLKISEAVKLDLKSKRVETKSNLKSVSQIIEMDGRIMIPFRGAFYVIEGRANIGEDILKSVPTKEELQIDI
jgi:hypothetical protein